MGRGETLVGGDRKGKEGCGPFSRATSMSKGPPIPHAGWWVNTVRSRLSNNLSQTFFIFFRFSLHHFFSELLLKCLNTNYFFCEFRDVFTSFVVSMADSNAPSTIRIILM